ncbi:MAG TPA: helix-turn-helix transcriptional regulator [Bacteroidia bacterium]|nr:helix-turn-helix transcriptional regulator [Bacteroidia bacterium]
MDKRIQKIADKLKKLRVEAGYTSAETFAFEKDINRVQYWRMEKGSNFTMNSLIKILDVHKLTLEEFFKGIK